jgi:hypothetical protein
MGQFRASRDYPLGCLSTQRLRHGGPGGQVVTREDRLNPDPEHLDLANQETTSGRAAASLRESIVVERVRFFEGRRRSDGCVELASVDGDGQPEVLD